jgi:hypothetical protein
MALSVPLSRPTLRVGGGSAFYVRPLITFGFCVELVWLAVVLVVRFFGESEFADFDWRTARAGYYDEQVRSYQQS